MTGSATGAGAMLIASVALSAALPLVGAPAASATEFRFWSSWSMRGGEWEFAAAGPGSRAMVDGSVEGWRLLIGNLGARTPPRVPASQAFDLACADVPREKGTARVAIVIDPGAVEDAPPGQQPGDIRTICASVPEGANGYQALAQAADLRLDRGLVCGIDGYPATECAPPVQWTADQPTGATLPETTANPPIAVAPSSVATAPGPLPTIAAMLAAAAVAFAAWRVARARRGAP